MCMEIIRSFLSQRPPSNIFHYTSAAATINILTSEIKHLRATNIRHLNDSSEYRGAQIRVIQEMNRRGRADFVRVLSGGQQVNTLQAIGQTAFDLASLNDPVFVVSFSEEEDLLSQWRAYCPHGDGYSLGFDASDFPGNAAEEVTLVKCVYTAEDAAGLCNALIESWDQQEDDQPPDMNRMIGDCMAIMAAVKHPGFAEEKEWRLVGTGGNQPKKFRSGRHGIVPYIEVPFGIPQGLRLKSVCLGPNSDKEAARVAIRSVAEMSGFMELEYNVSHTPFRG